MIREGGRGPPERSIIEHHRGRESRSTAVRGGVASFASKQKLVTESYRVHKITSDGE